MPKSVKYWPTFAGSKQDNARLTDVYFERYCGVNKTRIDDIIDNLRDTKDVSQIVGIGLPGIAKSTEINTYLMTFLKNMSIANTNSKWPNHVWYRCGRNMYQFSLNPNGLPEVTIVPARNLYEIEDLVEQCAYVNDLVLFLDMQETEIDPVLRCRFYLPLSSGDVYAITKSTEKSHGSLFSRSTS